MNVGNRARGAVPAATGHGDAKITKHDSVEEEDEEKKRLYKKLFINNGREKSIFTFLAANSLLQAASSACGGFQTFYFYRQYINNSYVSYNTPRLAVRNDSRVA